MSFKTYKWCAVSLCTNTTIKTPEKIFVHVPTDVKMRQKWLNLARRDPGLLSTKTALYFCEDHFDLPNDMVNYMQYRIMGSISQVRMKRDCIPSKFECLPDQRKRTKTTTERSYVHKKRKLMTLEECLNKAESSTVATSAVVEDGISDWHMSETNLQGTKNQTADKSIQVNIKKCIYRSKTTQTEIHTKNQAASPLKNLQRSLASSPFKIDHTERTKPSVSVKILEDSSNSESSLSSSELQSDFSPPVQSLQRSSSSDCSELNEEHEIKEASEILRITLKKIMKNTSYYVGVPNSCHYLIDLIREEIKIPEHHLIMCLKKFRLDNKFTELADDFAMDSAYASKIFLKCIPLIASVLQPFIVKLDPQIIKKTLPIAFRHKYHNVSCIIDCLEIKIQKPMKAVNQAVTWSEYKKANTIKYLISCTPNGLVNYISPGFSGRTTDTCIVENSNFVQTLSPGMHVMADRGFKHVEKFLHQSGIQLVRPPSAGAGANFTKSEARLTKQVASLRIHIERVIRRIRAFDMLKPHSCMNTKLVKVIDEIIIIVCALINLQDSIIK